VPDVLARIGSLASTTSRVTTTDRVIEAIVESLEVKRRRARIERGKSRCL
jgi:3-hydroxyacyl-CoA dehydrogenase